MHHEDELLPGMGLVLQIWRLGITLTLGPSQVGFLWMLTSLWKHNGWVCIVSAGSMGYLDPTLTSDQVRRLS